MILTLICNCSAGGLVTAVAPVVIHGKGLWVGWPGIHLPSDFDDSLIPESKPEDQTPTAGLKSEQVIDFTDSHLRLGIQFIWFLGRNSQYGPRSL